MENNVAKKYYRFGVLEGNHVEERFGLDHGRNIKDARMTGISETRDRFNLQSSMRGVIERRKAQPVHNTQLLAAQTLNQTYNFSTGKEALIKDTAGLDVNNDEQTHLAFTHQGVRPTITFGHGLDHENFYRREMETTYNLAHGHNIKPTTFQYSKFDTTTVPSVIKPDEKVYVKKHMRDVPQIGDRRNLQNQLRFKHYNEFTSSFDAAYNKTQLRK